MLPVPVLGDVEARSRYAADALEDEGFERC